jgi:hypothetical protein
MSDDSNAEVEEQERTVGEEEQRDEAMAEEEGEEEVRKAPNHLQFS